MERLVCELVDEPVAVGHVAEAPHPPDDRAVDPLRRRECRSNTAAVLELERVVALRVRAGVQLFDLRDERSGLHQLVQHELEAGASSRPRAPREAATSRANCECERGCAAFVDDEDPVGRRVQRRRQERQRRVEFVVEWSAPRPPFVLLGLRAEQPDDETSPRSRAPRCRARTASGRTFSRDRCDRDLAEHDADGRPHGRMRHTREPTSSSTRTDEHVTDRQCRSPADRVDDRGHRQHLRRQPRRAT